MAILTYEDLLCLFIQIAGQHYFLKLSLAIFVYENGTLWRIISPWYANCNYGNKRQTNDVEPGHDNGSPSYRWNNFAPLKLLSMQCRIIHLQPIICTTTFNSS